MEFFALWRTVINIAEFNPVPLKNLCGCKHAALGITASAFVCIRALISWPPHKHRHLQRCSHSGGYLLFSKVTKGKKQSVDFIMFHFIRHCLNLVHLIDNARFTYIVNIHNFHCAGFNLPDFLHKFFLLALCFFQA